MWVSMWFAVFSYLILMVLRMEKYTYCSGFVWTQNPLLCLWNTHSIWLLSKCQQFPKYISWRLFLEHFFAILSALTHLHREIHLNLHWTAKVATLSIFHFQEGFVAVFNNLHDYQVALKLFTSLTVLRPQKKKDQNTNRTSSLK